MKTSLLLAILAGCYAVSSELEFRDHLNLQRQRYLTCMELGTQSAYTDQDIDNLITRCEKTSGYSQGDTI